ncbi:MAG TPA: histidine phosphatase family protein [Candidatus Cybelea sp.]|nr:histidine phosphatase family protein [Candidatus Cybelea sp.]
MRHGIAVEPETWRGTDFDRPLTLEGEQRIEREAIAIDELALGLDCIVTSPLLRAKQTAAAVAERLDMRAKVVEDSRLAGGFNLSQFAAILASHAGVSALMLVGHEPTMSAVIGAAIGGASVELKKAALAAIEVPDPESSPKGMLLSLIPPKVLVALGKRRR